jgi:hypothetical protein
MGNHDEQPERVWDEYQWERFLQQQDRKTEHYMDLLEKYMDHPDRDQIIAREMGWSHLLDGAEEDWLEEADAQLASELGLDEESTPGETEESALADFEMHPLYKASFALTVWIDQLFDELGDLQNHPAAVKLATQSAIASAKLAAALSDDDIDEIGMTIAYLKRALKAVSNAMEAAVALRAEITIARDRFSILNSRLFQIRDGVITLMGEYRTEWRRRYGS